MGPRGGDELNLILPGRNYGWPSVSNGSNYDGVDIPDHRAGDGFEPPKVWWNPSISPAGCSSIRANCSRNGRAMRCFGALSGQALIHVRIRGDQASKAEQWAMGAAHPRGRAGAATARSICWRTATTARGCCGSSLSASDRPDRGS